MVPCNSSRLGLSEGSSDYLGIQQFYLCPETVNFYIQGSLAGQSTQFIQMAVRECSQSQLDLKYGVGVK
jgi:hypothetical protein